ncbi:amino acid adenylation domain-containing protein [Paenibacillus sp. M.A.Huq-81]
MEALGATSGADPREKTIHQLFEEQVKQAPDNIAIVFKEQQLTYRELNEQANRLARTLRAKGVGAEQIVAIMADRSIEMVVGMLAILKAGGAYMPIDRMYPAERTQYMLKDSEAVLLLTYGVEAQLAGGTVEILDLGDKRSYAADDSNMSNVNFPNSPMYVIYTSGTTGRPKGILMPHLSIVNLLAFQKQKTTINTRRTLSLASVGFDVFTQETFSTLLFGGTLFVVEESVKHDPWQLIQFIESHEISTVFLPTAYLKHMISNSDYSDKLLQHTEHLVVAGEKLELNKEFIDNSLQRKAQIHNHYGPSETHVVTTFTMGSNDSLALIPPIGKPISNTWVYIVDESNNLQPTGASGELCISGNGLALGYLNRSELTAEKFVENPFVPGQRMYKTGDLARWLPDGNLEYLGRIDQQVKIRGYRVELGEIEAQLLQIASVQQAVVITLVDEAEQSQLCAYVVADHTLAVTEVKTALSSQLPAYMLPTYLVQLERMPLTLNGKVDRKALPAPEKSLATGATYVAPRNEAEAELIRIWQQVLGVQPIGVKEDFFNIGGHSLRAMLLVTRIHKAMGIRVTLRDIFQHPSVEELAKYIGRQKEQSYQPIRLLKKQKEYPASWAQKRLMVLSHLDGVDTGYNMPEARLLKGVLDVNRLERAIKSLIKRHEILRTSLTFVEGEAVQIVHDELEVHLERMDASGEELEGLIQGFVRSFDFGVPPLFRVGLIRMEEERHVLLWDMHHAIGDGFSIGIWLRDLEHLYRGEEPQPLRVHYKDYAVWQQERQGSEEAAREERYWLEQFAGEIPVLQLPADYPRPAMQSFIGEHVRFTVDRETMSKLRRVAESSNSTLYMVLLSAYNVLLWKYSGQEDIVVGTPVAGRMHADLEPLIGMFVNTLAIRNYPQGNQTFLGLLEQVKENVLQAFDHQGYPFGELVEKGLGRRDISRNPLFDTMFVLQNLETEPFNLEGLETSLYPIEQPVAKFDLTLEAKLLEDGGLAISFEYAVKLFKRETIERMRKHLQRIFQEVGECSEVPLSAIEMLDEEEAWQLTERFNDTYEAYSREKTIHQLFEERVEQAPDNIAIVFEEQQLTYRELNERANRLARTLREKGVTWDQRVGLMVERSLEMIVGVLAIMKAGGAYVPIDPLLPTERIQYMLEDSGANVLLLQGHLRERTFFPGELVVLDNEQAYHADGTNQESVSGAKNLIYVIYTSGSTGQPKGVLVEHRSVVNILSQLEKEYPMLPSDAFLLKTSYTFDVSVAELFGWFIGKGKLVILPPGEEKDPLSIIQRVEAQHITHLNFVPSMLGIFLNSLEESHFAKLRTLKYIFAAGEALTDKVVEKYRQLPLKARLENIYGPTEATIYATSYTTTTTGVGETANVPIGKPLGNVQTWIVDRLNRMQPIGVPGELCISGDGLARGYLNRPELTAEKFIRNPFKPEGRMYRTGDLAKWRPDGNIEYLGRIDHQVKIRGYRIELGEIEARLVEHKDVQEAIIVAIEQHAEPKLCAYYVEPDIDGKEALSAKELQHYLASKLPSYMIPSYFVRLEQMPLTLNGKVDRKALPKPEITKKSNSHVVVPRNEVEEQIAGIWSDLLGVIPGELDIDDNFFEIGGNSLLLIKMQTSINKHYSGVIKVSDLFKYPSISALSAFLTDKLQPKAAPAKSSLVSNPQLDVLNILTLMETGDLELEEAMALLKKG